MFGSCYFLNILDIVPLSAKMIVRKHPFVSFLIKHMFYLLSDSLCLTLGFNSVAKSDTPQLPYFIDIAEIWLSGGPLSFLLTFKKTWKKIIFFYFTFKNIKREFYVRSKRDFPHLKVQIKLSTTVSFQLISNSDRKVMRMCHFLPRNWIRTS